MKRTSKSPDETLRIASKLAADLRPGDVLALVGELGAGKTCFVKGLASGLGVPEGTYVRSPSFVLMNEYEGGRLPLYHFDFYRLADPDELLDLGLDEYFFGEGVTVVEWADRFPGTMPDGARIIEFRIAGESEREIEIVR